MLPSFIETHSGLAFYPLSPDVAAINIGDIAHALSNQCRFAGHTSEHYSVAQHCVQVSWLLEDWGCSRDVVLWGLMHDASEAYLVDLPTPLKNHVSFEPYRIAERHLMDTICQRFGMANEMPSEVKRADAAMLATEAKRLMPFRPEHWGALTEDSLPWPLTPWVPTEAKRNFLLRFEQFYRRVEE